MKKPRPNSPPWRSWYDGRQDITPAFTDIGALDDIPRLGARSVKTPAGDIAVFRTAGDEVFALRDQCPHKKGPLSQGIVHGTSVTCPLHAWVISLQTGEAQAWIPAARPAMR